MNQNDRNDGLVTVSSQKWKKELVASDGTPKPVAQNEFPFPADHLNEVGWWDLQEAVLGSRQPFKKTKKERKAKRKQREGEMEEGGGKKKGRGTG